jgi:2-polyprenyl-3-methyl-5-hydroxy-6-metoxy-1,4-benzoquinol methylase
MKDLKRVQTTRRLWDNEAATFDNEPDHGLRQPHIRNAWRTHLLRWLPPAPKRILDIGCGTGSLSLLMAELGHQVSGIDLSPAMIAQAETKARIAGQSINLQMMDAVYPHLPPAQFDVLLCRHLLWALPEPAQVLQRWMSLLAAGGRMILIEGFWHTGAGLHAEEVVNALPAPMGNITVQRLSDDTDLWGSAVNDERYAVIADSYAAGLSSGASTAV